MGSDTYIYTNFFVVLSNFKESSEEQVATFQLLQYHFSKHSDGHYSRVEYEPIINK